MKQHAMKTQKGIEVEL